MSGRRKMTRSVGVAAALAAICVGTALDELTPKQKFRYERLPLTPEQVELCDADLVDQSVRFTICEATTKVGKTFSHLETLLDRAIQAGEGNWWWVAPSGRQARIAFDRAKDRLAGYLQKPVDANVDEAARPNAPRRFERVRVADPVPFKSWLAPDMRVQVNGATISFLTAERPDLLFGDDVRGLVGDEITRWREESWQACYTVLSATHGWAKLIGNVKGRKNFAFQLARKAEAGESGWYWRRLTAEDAVRRGLMDPAVVEAARRDLPKAVYEELYLAIPSPDTGCPFGDVAACQMDDLAYGDPIVWGVDIARDVDWTVGYGLNDRGEVCRMFRFQRSWDDTIRIVSNLSQPTYVDETGLGKPVVELMQKERPGGIIGVDFGGNRKQGLMNALQVAIERREIRYPKGVTVSELEAFEYEYTRTGVRYSAPDGAHDDCVCALALAWAGWQQVPKALPEIVRAGGSSRGDSPWT